MSDFLWLSEGLHLLKLLMLLMKNPTLQLAVIKLLISIPYTNWLTGS